MCRFISFFHKADADGKPKIAIWNLSSHGETEKHLKLNTNLWQEGHYLPDGEIELRYNDSFKADKVEYEDSFKNRFPKFQDFLKWCLDSYKSICGFLDLRGCNLQGITLPKRISGYLDLEGCDLKGITLPESIGGSLYLRGCDLRGITLPKSIGGSLNLEGCDLRGITLPKRISGQLDLRGCTNTDNLIIPKNVYVYR